jgi:ribosomal protein S18 acetylase RimI-like enzyme
MDSSVVITRVAERHWHALDDDRVVGRGEASPRPDGRLFVSVDSWQSTVFDQLANAMLANLPTPLYTVVDEADHDLVEHWHRAGFTTRRREWEYVVPTGADPVPAPPGVCILGVGQADETRLRAVDRAIRGEVDWLTMPAEMLSRPDGDTVVFPSRYAVAAQGDRYVAMARVATLTRQPRIGVIAVLAEQRRRGIGRSLLTTALNWLHGNGFAFASAEVQEANEAAIALFEGIGARRGGSNLELVWG